MADLGRVRLGCGLLALGRIWGFGQRSVPTESEAFALLDAALDQGITFFDTAPSYGVSEERLGVWLQSLTQPKRDQVFVATKCGEHWGEKAGVPFTDFTFVALRRSINRSLKRLGRINLLQLHKASIDVLNSRDFWNAIEYAKSQGIEHFGLSTNDPEVANIALAFPDFEYVQMTYSRKNKEMHLFFKPAWNEGKQLIINRPFNMGAMVTGLNGAKAQRERVNAFRFILKQEMRGYILTGTTSVDHLKENVRAFKQAAELEC